VVLGAVEGELSGGLSQVASNMLSGRAWNADLFSAGISGGIAGGIGGGLGWVARSVAARVRPYLRSHARLGITLP
jgi:hypothetical protein